MPLGLLNRENNIYLPPYQNIDSIYMIQLSNIRADISGSCPPDAATFTYQIFRTPEVDIIKFLCKDDSPDSLLVINPKDTSATWDISKNGEPINLYHFGNTIW
ncbi:MAG: hypothetical protein IPL63_14065 [Saprospiraceae bacterium]|nr:hypothetical protein [Saprospiraceae bacterium]